jgi:hypothetical protein
MKDTLFAMAVLSVAAIVACTSSPLTPDRMGTAGATGSAGTTGAGGTTGSAGTTGAVGTTGVAGTPGTGTPGATGLDGQCVAGAYHRPKATDPCTCQDGSPDVCDLVGCTDKKLDPENCGACGKKCNATAVCNRGACGADPTVLVQPVAGCIGMTLAINSGSVFYADQVHGTINKLGDTAAIVTGEMGPTWLASNGANLFWYDKASRTIRSVPAAGGAANDVYKNTTTGPDGGVAPEIGGFLVSPDATTIYISLGRQVLSAPLTAGVAGTTTVVANEDFGEPAALALDGTAHIVFPANDTAYVDAPILGGATPAECGKEDAEGNIIMTTCPRLGRTEGLYQYVAVIDGRAFWVDGWMVKSEMIAARGSTFEPVTTSYDQGSITAITNTADTVYLAEDGFIEKAPATVNANNTPPTLLARGQPSPQSIVVDAAKVYWATSSCSIASIVK